MNKINMYENLTYNEKKVDIKVMSDNDTLKEIRILFKQNQIMADHKTSFPITIQILEGEINFSVNDAVHKLEKGHIVTLEANIVHNLKANIDSIVRLTLSKFDKVSRVKDLL